MKLSIIIPVYNVIDTLQFCVNSVIKQSFSDYEMIFVDDGSTDGSSLLCDKIANENSNCNISVIHQQNKGLSEARNKGIEIAKGQYITFIDSDDSIDSDTYQLLMKLIEDKNDLYDIVEYPVIVNYGNHKKQYSLDLKCAEYTNMIDYWICGLGYKHSYAWNKIYKRELFRDIRFPKGKAFEDVYTLPKLLGLCKCIATTNLGMYYYRWNPKGITSMADGKDFTDLLNANKEAFNNRIFNIIQNKEATLNSRYSDEIGKYYSYLLNIQIQVYEGTHKKPILPVLPYYNTAKLKVMHIIGIKGLCKIIEIIHKVYHRS